MQNTFTRTVFAVASAIMLTLPVARAATPGQPVLSMSFELTGEHGQVAGTVTAPLTDIYQKALPEGMPVDITVRRSAYSLGQTDLTVAVFKGMKPGDSAEFIDNITPVWEMNQDYTYTALAEAPGYEFHMGYGAMKPGLAFVFPQNALILMPGTDSVGLEVTAPSKMESGVELEEPMTALEFYRATNTTWPYTYKLLHSVPDPVPGETYSYTDKEPRPDMTNYYRVRAVTKYGYADTNGSCYVGLDVPAAPYPVTATATPEGAVVSWTAPDRGENWGAIDPAGLWYNVYRCRGYGATNRELIATQITETEFTDTGSDLTEPLEVRYEVQAGNAKGLGGSNFSSPDYDIIVGPSYTLPFTETFDGGFTKVWTLADPNYFTRWYEATEAEYGDWPVKRVKPVQGSGLVYVDYVYNSPASGSRNSLTSYKIDMERMENPVMSFWYYAIPDTDVTISVASASQPDAFAEDALVSISEDAAKAEWRRMWVPLKGAAGSASGYLRLTTSFTNLPSSAIIDDVRVYNYPGVSDLEAEVDETTMAVTLTWSLPEEGTAECKDFVGYVNGAEWGEISSPWIYDGLEYDHAYTFSVRPVYEGVEVEASVPCGVLVRTPVPSAFTVGDYDYVVLDTTDADESEAPEYRAYVAGYHGRGGLLRMPASVTYQDMGFTVCGVDAGALAGNKDVESLTLPEGYMMIGAGAFRDMTELMALSVPASMLTIDDMAFTDCRSLMTVSFAGRVPPYVGTDAFAGIAPGCKGKCPDGAAAAYAVVENLATIDFGIDVGVDVLMERWDVRKEWFDLTGCPIPAPRRGEAAIVRLTAPDGTVRVAKRLM
ncbi:MAG: leucine-rich repeat domain-containing protein [Muribaculaceae bacterium]|nr:leucine-rich repeat domain-containing protein [Muribaculaceae bacterium]